MDNNDYREGYKSGSAGGTERNNGSTWKWVWGVVALIVIVLVGWWFVAVMQNPDNTTNNTTTNNTTTTTTTIPVTDMQSAWASFQATYACVPVTVASTTKVLQFTNSSATTTDNGAAAFKCNDGHTYIY